MICSNCGKELLEGAKFCAHCGVQAETIIPSQNDNDLPQTTPQNNHLISKPITFPLKKTIPTNKQRTISLVLGAILFLFYWIVIDQGMHGISQNGTETGRLILYSAGYYFWYFWKIVGRNKWIGAILGIFIAIAVLLAGATIRAAHIRDVDTNISTKAEWVKVFDNEQATIYADSNHEHQNNHIVKMWNIFDYKNSVILNNKPQLSLKTENEYDCSKNQVKLIIGYAYSERMASGIESVADFSTAEWADVRPDSTGSALFNFACK